MEIQENPETPADAENVEAIIRSKREQRKRKKKKFLQNSRGFGKKGIFGRGTVLEEDQGSYFINISDVIRTGFENLDEKCKFLLKITRKKNKKLK